MEHRGAHTIARLTKRDVEELLAGYDADPRAALTRALRVVLARPDASWEELLRAAKFSAGRAALLDAGDTATLDQLAAELNELRALGPGR